mgnify:CR=1 FL=1
MPELLTRSGLCTTKPSHPVPNKYCKNILKAKNVSFCEPNRNSLGSVIPKNKMLNCIAELVELHTGTKTFLVLCLSNAWDNNANKS